MNGEACRATQFADAGSQARHVSPVVATIAAGSDAVRQQGGRPRSGLARSMIAPRSGALAPASCRGRAYGRSVAGV